MPSLSTYHPTSVSLTLDVGYLSQPPLLTLDMGYLLSATGHPITTQSPLTRIYGNKLWTSPDNQHQNQVDYILWSQRWRSSIQSAKTRPGADCAKFRLKLKKVGKTTRPFKYDLNQIPYDCTVEVRNIFKGLDLIDRVPDELWTEVRDSVQETGIKTIPKKKKSKKQNGCLRRPYK